MNIEEWKSQLKRGILEYCILLLIRSKPSYGYEIMSEISRWNIIAAKESTIYPLLRRLLKEGYLEASWKESQEGIPPRKYYHITDSGREFLDCMSLEWHNLVEVIGELKGRKVENDGE